MPMNGNNSDVFIDLEKAEVSGHFGQIYWHSWAPAKRNVIIVKWYGEKALPDLKFVPAVSESPRKYYSAAPKGYAPNPPVKLYEKEGYNIAKQTMLAGGEYTTVWKSFVSVGEDKVDRLYWTQLYKFGSATRADGVTIDLMGPWYHQSPWPAIWWNLNLQLTYAPLFNINHFELAKPLVDLLDNNVENLKKVTGRL